MAEIKNKKEITLIGAGLVGSLLAIYLSKIGYQENIFERRSDMRTNRISAGKSINLALSDRGWKGLQGAGVADEIKKVAIPMKGRQIHNLDGTIAFLPYGKEGQAIYSVSRGGLNCVMMDLAEKYGAKINFNER
jgi:kynurenine 3-monooxygenase